MSLILRSCRLLNHYHLVQAASSTDIPNRRTLHTKSDSSSKEQPFKVIPFEFDKARAAELFLEHDSGRWFAPLPSSIKEGIVVRTESPLKKVYLPFFAVNADVERVDYKGEYGVKRTEYTYTAKGKPIPYTVTDWYDTHGSVGRCVYSPEDEGMMIYSGFDYPQSIAERALKNCEITNRLQNFDRKKVDSKTHVDPFLKRSAIVQEVARERLWNYSQSRIRRDIRWKSGYDDARVISGTTHYNDRKFTACYIPVYILQYPQQPPRVMLGFGEETSVSGPAPISVLKTVLATVPFALTFAFMPQFSIPIRAAQFIALPAIAGLWAKFRLSVSHYTSERTRQQKAEHNQEVSETRADHRRRIVSESFHVIEEDVNNEMICVDQKVFTVLGLDYHAQITKEKVIAAFHKRIRECHPDLGGTSTKEVTQVIEARNTLINALKRGRVKPVKTQKRFFSHIATRFPQTPPRSVYSPHARKLMDLVLKEKNYPAAKKLVDSDLVHPDAHDRGENTLLAEAAKIGDVRAIEFAIDELWASPDCSCDCPAHRTPLHYAAKGGNPSVIKALLDRKATVNLIDTGGNTPLDIAIQEGNGAAIKMLKGHGARQHTTDGEEKLSLKKLFGYSPDDRTMLLEEGYQAPAISSRIQDELE